MAASTTSSSPLPTFVIRLFGPDDASASERRLWDKIYKHIGIPTTADTSQSDIIGNNTTGNNIEMSPDSPTATLVDPNEPIPKWHVEDNGLAEPLTHVIGHMPFAQSSTSSGDFRQNSRGQYINPNHFVHHARRGTATNVDVKFGAYTMIMGIDQDVPERLQQPEHYGEAIRKSKFRLLVDTGSNTTWLFGRDYKELVPTTSITRDEPGTAPVFDAREWKINDNRDRSWGTVKPFHEVLIRSGFRFGSRATEGSRRFVVESTFPNSVGYDLRYLSGNLHTRVFLSEAFEIVQIGQCYSWTPTLSRLISITFNFRFAGAAGVSFHLDRMPVDGVLGLGMMDKQQGFENLADAPSFLNAIQRCVSGPRESLQSSAPCLYFALRTPGSTLKENWIAINNWPLTKAPLWSRKIKVFPFVAGNNPQYCHWQVKLVSMAIVLVDANGRTETIPNGNLPISESTRDPQCRVILDTGSSLSYVPERVVTHLRALYPCSENTTRAQSTEKLEAPFVVPTSARGVQSSSEALWIEYKFVGRTAGETVTIHGPIDPFLCCRNPHIPNQRFKEGLLCPFNTITNRREASFDMLFGLNFFHSMFVALHCGTTTTEPYVELAYQVQGDAMNEYKLPPVSEEE